MKMINKIIACIILALFIVIYFKLLVLAITYGYYFTALFLVSFVVFFISINGEKDVE